MGKREENLNVIADKLTGAGTITRTVGTGQHDEYTAAEWSGVRSAAVTSLAALDAWYAACGDTARADWWAALPAGLRAKYRDGILLLSA